MRLMISAAIILLLKIAFPLICFGFILLLTTFMYIAYIDSDVNYNLLVYICWWLYYGLCAVQVAASIMTLTVVFPMLIFYLHFRFDQINDKFKKIDVHSNKKINFYLVVKIINEHYLVSQKVTEFNRMTNKILGIYYVGLTMAIDIAVYIAIYGYHPLVRILCGCIAMIMFLLAYTFVFNLGSLINKAHWSYQLINSLISTKTIPFRHKYKVI